MPPKKKPPAPLPIPKGFIYRDDYGKIRFNIDRTPFLTFVLILFLILSVISTGVLLIANQGEDQSAQSVLNERLIKRIGEKFDEATKNQQEDHTKIISYIKCILLLPPEQFRGADRAAKLEAALNECERNIFPPVPSSPTSPGTANPQASGGSTRSPPQQTPRRTTGGNTPAPRQPPAPQPTPQPTPAPTPTPHLVCIQNTCL